MKNYLYLSILFMGFLNTGFGQQSSKSDKWNWLIGDWKDGGSSQAGNESTTFSFTFDLDKKIIVRKSNTQYSDKKANQKSIRQDLMIIYPDQSGKSDKAICFDNEGHIINYRISFEGKSIIFLNYDKGNSPVYRLTYTRLDGEIISQEI